MSTPCGFFEPSVTGLVVAQPGSVALAILHFSYYIADMSAPGTSVGSAAIYCRISRDAGGQGLGVARQEELCRKLAAEKGMAGSPHLCRQRSVRILRGSSARLRTFALRPRSRGCERRPRRRIRTG